jgi:hypothetical protein
MARALRGQNLISSAKVEWEQALKDAHDYKERLVALLRMATQWDWSNEQEQLLWTFVTEFQNEKWAPSVLGQLLYVRGRTQGLLALFSHLSKANPSDLEAKNNLAMTALLLDAQQLSPHRLAREVYESAPTNFTYASTYAFSLHLQKRHVEALSVIQQLNAQELEQPPLAAYYGLVLHGAGDQARARRYLDIATKSTLLPEERKLVDQARRL